MSFESTANPSHGKPHAGASPAAVSLEKDILPHLAGAARALAIKGFSPDEATAENEVCGLTVRGINAGIEGRITFTRKGSGTGGVAWAYAVTAPQVADKSENGAVEDGTEAEQVIEAFVSVFTTVASFAVA